MLANARRRPGWWIRGVLLPGLCLGLAACAPDQPVAEQTVATDVAAEPVYVGGVVCAGCHQEQAAAWTGSHHDLAMQPANPDTVLGDFNDAEFRYGDVTTRFTREDDQYSVRTDGADGQIREFPVQYSFGVYPLQQYLIALDDGQVQALSIAWDARPSEQGGQRWFHLYPDESVDFSDPLHWTGEYQRWNTMCADCHSTALEKGYQVEQDRFDTRWQSIDVDCEACHGPGSVHAAAPDQLPPAANSVSHQWVFSAGNSIASRLPPPGQSGEVENCAACHSLRTQLTDQKAPGDEFLDSYRPSLLADASYHPDGQILGEVYVYGSFLQSRMAGAGVVCSDCHDPHSTELRAEGNALCAQCHLASTYDVTEHHRHQPGTAGSECVDCHMRSETYMVVDPRRDHSFRVPRPDLSSELATPNACNDCHADETPAWAAGQISDWFPEGQWNGSHYGEALYAGRSWAADAHALLVTLAGDRSAPAIVRASAISELSQRLTAADIELLESILDTEGPLIRLAAIEASMALPPEARVGLVQRFLTDDLLALRIAAGRALVPARASLSARRQSDLDAAIDEYLEVQAFNSDRPEGMLNAAAVAVEQDRNADAEATLLRAIERYPQFVALHVNLAELYRDTGRSSDAERVLREVLERGPEDPAVRMSLGFALVRAGQPEDALPEFERAAELAPADPYYRYVVAIAVNDGGDTGRAIELLRAAQQQFPGYPDIVFALATMLRDAGDTAEALRFAQLLVDLMPGDTQARELLSQLEQL